MFRTNMFRKTENLTTLFVHETYLIVHDPWVGTDSSVTGEAFFAIIFNGQPKNVNGDEEHTHNSETRYLSIS